MTDEATKAYEAMIEAMARAIGPLVHVGSHEAAVMAAERAAEAIGLKPGCVVVDVAAINDLAARMAAEAREDWNAIYADGCDGLAVAINAMIAARPT